MGAVQLPADFTQVTKPYAYFNRSIAQEISNITVLLSENEESENLYSALLSFQIKIHRIQRKVAFGYEMLLYFSAFLTLGSLALIIHKKNVQNTEFIRLKTASLEHAKFSRDLHDGVAQDLTALKIAIQEGEAEKASFYSARALREVRYLIDSLHSNLLENIEDTIRETVHAFEVNCNIEASLVIASDFLRDMEAQSQLEILHILQEALSNIARHANATLVQVKITDVAEGLSFVIKDNGIGFSEETAQDGAKDAAQNRKRWGVANIKNVWSFWAERFSS